MQRPSSESSIIQTIYEKEQQNQRAIQQNRDAGIHGRQNVNDALGSLIQPPGNVGQIQRNIIDVIRARVLSQGGHVVAGAKLYVRVSVCYVIEAG